MNSSCQTPGHGARRLQLPSALAMGMAFASSETCIKSSQSLKMYANFDSCFQSPPTFTLGSGSLRLSSCLHHYLCTRHQLIRQMSMAPGSGTSSGQGSKQVSRYLQMIRLSTDANLFVSARKWPCKVCFRVSFDRRVDLDRHIQLIHLPCCVYCPYSQCEWRGCRVDELQKHLDQQKCDQNYAARDFRIYEVKMILDIIVAAESNESIRTAEGWAVDMVLERAKQLGKPAWIADPWGCLERRERRERRMSGR